MRRLALLFFVSGAAGLVHEVAWARALGQGLGNSLQSLAAVLVAFLGGLGLGAALGARAAGRSPAPLRGYALLEFAVGLYGVASPLVVAALPGALEALGPRVGPGAPLSALRLLLAVLALAPATLPMGATLPYLIREAVARGAASSNAVSFLYGANTLGAACGALAGSLFLLPSLGTRLTYVAAGAVNLLVGAAALAMQAPGRGRAVPAPPPSPAAVAAAEPAAAGDEALARARRRLALAAAAISGAIGALLQFGWTRAIALTFGSSIYALGITLTAYILGIGIGPLIVAGRLRRPGAEVRVAALAQWVAGVSSLALLPVLGRLPARAAEISGRLDRDPLVMIALQFALVAACLLTPTIAQGATFPALSLLAGGGAAAAHGGAARAYAASSWGSVAGFLLAGFFAVPTFGTQHTLAAASVACLALSAALLAVGGPPRPGPAGRPGRLPARAQTVLLVATAIAAPLGLLLLPPWDPALMAGGGFLYGPVYRAAGGATGVREAMRRRGEFLFIEDSGESLVTVRRSPAGILSLQINGKTEASTGGDMATQLLAGHLPLLMHPRPRDVLIVGLASGVTLGAVERHPIERVEVIEIAPAVLPAARRFDAVNGRALEDPRARVVIDDARGRLLASRDLYDVITSQPSNPWVAGVSNLFTREFYGLARRRLRPGGLFCQWVQAYRLAPEDLRGIVRSFLEVFPDATLWEESAGGGDYFLIGGNGAVRMDPERLSGAGVAGALLDLRRAGIETTADLLARFVTGPRGLAAFSAGARPHTDDDLYLEARAPLALFRDTLREQAAAIARNREPVLSYLPEDLPRRDPALAAALAERLRRGRGRLAILDSLKDADLWALRDPFMAAGIEYLRAGLFVEAAGPLLRASLENPDSGATHLLLGEAYRAAGLDAAAAVAFRRAVEADPGLAPAWNALGRYLLDAGRDAEARAAFETALRADPDSAAARSNLAAALLRQDDLKAAETACRQALAADPLMAPARANLGLVLKRRGDLAGAEAQYRAALDLDPLNADARYNLAMLLRQTGRAAEARQALARLLAIDPGDREAERALRAIEAGNGSP